MLTEIHNSVVKLRKKESKKMQRVHNEMAWENPKLLEVVFGDFLETVAIHFDEIYALLVEDLLVEEINELNRIENRRLADLKKEVKKLEPRELIEDEVPIEPLKNPGLKSSLKKSKKKAKGKTKSKSKSRSRTRKAAKK